MKIFYDINISKLKQEILAMAKFQKVVILLDEYSNLEVVGKLEKEIKKETVCYKINDVSAVNLIEFLNDGTRCVISFLSDKTFFRVFNELGESLNIFILKYNGLIAPYLSIKNANSMMFVDKNYKIEECEILIFSNALIEQTWNNILHYQNYKKIEFNEFFEIFRESDKNTKDLINFYSKNKWVIKNIDKFECCFFDLNDFEIYLYIRLVSIKYLFLSFFNNTISLTDFYKDYENNILAINYSYQMVNNERVLFVFKNYSIHMLNLIDIIIKNYLKIKNNKYILNNNLNLILKTLKKYAKTFKHDNLLKYSYLFNIFSAI